VQYLDKRVLFIFFCSRRFSDDDTPVAETCSSSMLVIICILGAFVVSYIDCKNMHVKNNIQLYLSKINIFYSYKSLLVKRIEVKENLYFPL